MTLEKQVDLTQKRRCNLAVREVFQELLIGNVSEAADLSMSTG